MGPRMALHYLTFSPDFRHNSIVYRLPLMLKNAP
jgi:hypothetical protein